jgi:hypothetical protein
VPSLVETLGATLRRIGADLPLAELTHAAERLRSATALAGYVMHESGHAEWLIQLTAAGQHLDDAIAATSSVLDGLDGYLVAIGLAGVPHDKPVPAARTAGPAGPGTGERADPVLALRNWWAERVDLLSGRPPAEERPVTARGADGEHRVAPEEPVDTLVRLARCARSASADGYREQLLATHPASGMQVAAPAARALRYLGTDLLRRPPGPGEARKLTERCRPPRVRELLPRIEDTVAPALVGQVCGVVDTEAARYHPVDVAAAWPVLVAELLRALGRDESVLSELVTAPPERSDDTDADPRQRLNGQREPAGMRSDGR